MQKPGLAAKVSHVYDGDTLKLVDGRKIRLIGINTPEMGRDGEPDEPGAETARQRLTEILQASDNQIIIKTGKELQDRYKRTLAHIYSFNHQNITEILLREGLGYAVYFPPNLMNLQCYQKAEQAARAGRRGLWRQPGAVLDVSRMSGHEEGFYHIQGEVERIGKGRRALWVNLKYGPSIRIDWSDWHYFQGRNADEWVGKRLEVRGWIYRRKGRQRMQVRHPAALQWLDSGA